MLGGLGVVIALVVYSALHDSELGWQRGIGNVAGGWAVLCIGVYGFLLLIWLANRGGI